MQRYLISYEFNDGDDQEVAGDMLLKWYESGGVENSPETYDVHSWVFMIQNGIAHCVFMDCLKVIELNKRIDFCQL